MASTIHCLMVVIISELIVRNHGECSLNCLNNGECVENEYGEPICVCATGFGGQLCQCTLIILLCLQTIQKYFKNIIHVCIIPMGLKSEWRMWE